MKKLSDEKIVEIRELKRAGASVRRISKALGASLGAISHYTNDIEKTPPIRKQHPVTQQKRVEAIPFYPKRQPHTHVVIAPPSGRGIGAGTPEKPIVPVKPLTKMQKEIKTFQDKKWIDFSWVKTENERRRSLNRKIHYEEKREKKNSEYRINFARNINEITRMMNERRKAKERENYDSIIASEQNGLTKEGIRNAIKEVAVADKEEQEKMMNAYASFWQIQHGEAVRVKKKKINDKFLADVTPSVLGFVGNIVKSFVIVSKIPKSKPKIVMAQLVKEPMLAKVIK